MLVVALLYFMHSVTDVVVCFLHLGATFEYYQASVVCCLAT